MQLATHIANPVRVIATAILEVTDITDRSKGRGQSSPDLMLRLADGRNYKADISMTSRYVPVAGDYLVTQEDGYEYLNPKDVFERKYRAIDDNAMTFGLAIEALKRGQRVARAGWNGKGMFAYLVPANAYPAQTGAAKAFFGEGALVPYNAYFALKGVDGTVSTWAPSGSDALAEDWQIVETVASSIPPHQQRVIDEKAELDDKLTKLKAFFDTPIFAGLDPNEQDRLCAQSEAMGVYAEILAQRIAAF
jgi:hypothetical protein